MVGRRLRLGLWNSWWRQLGVRGYERILYALVVPAGAVWGAFSIGVFFAYPPSNGAGFVLSAVVLWPAWLDLGVFHLPGIIESAVVGAAGTAVVMYALLTASHLSESKRTYRADDAHR
jgi:hypothetical protein